MTLVPTEDKANDKWNGPCCNLMAQAKIMITLMVIYPFIQLK